MQLTLVDSGRQVAPRTAAHRTAALPAGMPARTAGDALEVAPAGAVAPLRGGLKGIDPLFNRQVAGMQRALDFLDQADSQLRDLKATLGARLGRGDNSGAAVDTDGAALEQRIRRFGDLWRERTTAAAGTLDNQLRYIAPGQARQKFSVRGLQMSSLRSGDQETLSFSVAGKSQRAVSVVIEPASSAAALATRFDRALAPSGIRAQLEVRGDAQQDLSFSVPEDDWPRVRDALAIKGEGRRFPTGQFSQLRLVPEEPVLRPDDWSGRDAAAMRRTLQYVLNAQQTVYGAHREVSNALAEVGNLSDARALTETTMQQSDSHWSAEFAESFAATASRPDYQSLSAIAPALIGIERRRVVALLSVAPT